jgi:hypothetical protein
MQFFTLDKDDVITGYVVNGSTSYEFALENFVPLMGRLDIQRDVLKTKFYSRLELDILRGCVMPPITVALIQSFGDIPPNPSDVFDFIASNINQGFVLDGMQRLNTLVRASKEDGFDANRPLQVNFILAPSRDRLLYRMITLNNGQRPMSARHQIDVLADSFFDFDDIQLDLVTEKSKGRVRAPDSFKKADFVKGYIAYLSESVSIDNQKIIEEKMDELIANRIIESDIPTRKIEFSDVVDFINLMSQSPILRDWIRVQNNFIGFCVGIRGTIETLKSLNLEEIEKAINNFEDAFSSINVSKVNLGKVRRETVSQFIKEFGDVKDLDEFRLLDKISEWI